MKVLIVAGELLREAASRKWFIALGLAVTAVLALLAATLRLDIVDGALAAARLFGADLSSDIVAVDVAFRPVLKATALVIFYGGVLFGIVSCADFGPALFSPGRVEHMLAQPVRRWQLLLGTYLGVCGIACALALYGAGGVAVLVGFKTGFWSLSIVAAGLLAALAFVVLYAVMLTVAVFVPSSALCATAGMVAFAAGVLASFPRGVAEAVAPGIVRTALRVILAPLPRVSQLAELAGEVAQASSPDPAAALRLVGGAIVFALAVLALGASYLERRDF